MAQNNYTLSINSIIWAESKEKINLKNDKVYNSPLLTEEKFLFNKKFIYPNGIDYWFSRPIFNDNGKPSKQLLKWTSTSIPYYHTWGCAVKQAIHIYENHVRINKLFKKYHNEDTKIAHERYYRLVSNLPNIFFIAEVLEQAFGSLLTSI